MSTVQAFHMHCQIILALCTPAWIEPTSHTSSSYLLLLDSMWHSFVFYFLEIDGRQWKPPCTGGYKVVINQAGTCRKRNKIQSYSRITIGLTIRRWIQMLYIPQDVFSGLMCTFKLLPSQHTNTSIWHARPYTRTSGRPAYGHT